MKKLLKIVNCSSIILFGGTTIPSIVANADTHVSQDFKKLYNTEFNPGNSDGGTSFDPEGGGNSSDPEGGDTEFNPDFPPEAGWEVRPDYSKYGEIKSRLMNIAFAFSQEEYHKGNINITEVIHGDNAEPWSFSETPLAIPNDDMKIVDGDTLAANTTTFSNDTDSPMTYNTPKFAYKSTTSMTTSTTNSVDLGVTTSVEMKFPVASGSMSITAKYGFSTTHSETTSEEYSWEVPTQNIPVKPGQKIRVDWVLKTGQAEGTVQLKDRIKAILPFRQDSGGRSGYHIGQIVSNKNYISDGVWEQYIKEPRDKWVQCDGENSKLADFHAGEASYKAKYGTEMLMKVIDITDGDSKSRVIKTVPVKSMVSRVN